MLDLRIVRIREDAGSAMSLPLSVTDYINQKKGIPRLERATGMLLLNDALARLGIKDYRVDVLHSGKPVLRGSTLHFSISHSKGLCAMALSDAPVGIDLQDTEAFDRIELLRFASRFLSPDEHSVFLEEPTKEQLCRIWTRKEALAKLLGRPLSSSLRTLSSLSFEGVTFETRRACLDSKLFFLTIAQNNKEQI